MLESFVQILFYGTMLLFVAHGFLLIYVLLQFGQSKALGLILTGFYLVAILALYFGAQYYLNKITFFSP